jgi:hypothetical protein
MTNTDLAQIVADNHAETVQRLTRMETLLAGVPERVAVLETKSSKDSGARSAFSLLFSVASVIFTAILALLKFKH